MGGSPPADIPHETGGDAMRTGKPTEAGDGGTRRRRVRRGATVAAGAAAVLAAAATAQAFVNLPASGARVDNDPAAGINPARDAGAVDAVSGSLLAGGPAVPWTIFEHATRGEQQIFVRAFKNGAWVTQGVGTVNGASSASPTFRSSLNFAQDKEGEAPSIDFAGAGRTVPWATWYEDDTAPFGHKEIFASRFDQATQTWVFAGQGRTATGGPPSLNIDVAQDAENPQVAGGTTVAGGNPGPWITWQEKGPTKDQIFVVKPIGPGTVTCPAGTKPAGGNPVGGFCWQQVGVERSAGEPSLERRSQPQRDRAGHRLHGPGRHRAVGGLVRAGPRVLRREERARLRGQGRDGRRRLGGR